MTKAGTMNNESSNRVETLYGTIARHATHRPEHDALVVDGEVLSYLDLLLRVDALRGKFASVGGELAGKRVYLMDVSKLDLIVGGLATIGNGGIAVLAAGGGQNIIDDCDPELVCVKEAPTVEAVGFPHYITPDHLPSINVQVGGGRCYADPSDPVMILYTSGTTSGIRRGAVLTHGLLSVTTDYMNSVMEVDDSIREYVMSPLDHSFGFARCRAVFRAGGTLVFDEGLFNPARVLITADRQHCNALTSVSAGFAVLLSRFEKQLEKLGREIRWSEIGSLPLSLELKQRMLTLMPLAKIFMHYGLTEASRTTLLDLRRDPHKLDSVGRASPGVDVRISQDGEIMVHGPNVTTGYWQREDEWRERFRDGWLYTGDLGRMDEEGYVYVLGRKDDIINIGGKKILPKLVEDELDDLLPDQVYCVLGVPDPDGLLGEISVLAIEGSSNISTKEVRCFLFDRVPEFASPRNVICFESFPRTDNGKIQRHLIRKQAINRIGE